jgi:exosortase
MTRPRPQSVGPAAWLLFLVGVAAVTWAYLPTLGALAGNWASDAQASAGFVVPVFALAVLWLRRDKRPRDSASPSWWGLVFLLGAGALRLGGAYFSLDWFDGLALLPTLFGLVLLAGGWRWARWVLPALVVLIFMLPLPYGLEVALSGPLQGFATAASTFVLQTLGLPAVHDGNIILIDDTRIGVLEACNGLGMLTVFLALCTAAALALDRWIVDRVVLFLSAVPIAVLSNLVRLTATGFVTHACGPVVGNRFHDVAGWLMMPLALAIVWLELRLLDRLFVPCPGGGEERGSAPAQECQDPALSRCGASALPRSTPAAR